MCAQFVTHVCTVCDLSSPAVMCCRDIAPEGATLVESNKNLDVLTDLAADLMKRYDIKLLWNTCNLFAHPR